MSNNFGKLGDLNKYRGAAKPDLPQWLLDQMSVNNTTDESGASKTEYNFNNNPYGGFQRNGKYYVQVGSNKLKDPSAVTTDPELGDITEVGNVNDITPKGPNYAMLAAVLGAGLGGAAMGLGGESAGLGTAAATGGGLSTIDTGLSGLFTGMPELAPATAQYAADGAFAGAGAGLPTINTGLSSLFTGAPDLAPGVGSAAPGAGGTPGGLASLSSSGAAPVTDLSVQAQQPSLLQQAGNYITNNPASAARLGLGLASLGASAAGARPTSGGTSTTDAGSIIDQMAQANRVNQNTPIGSRAWSQGPDGQWTVNDTLSPAEQANFENVQGLNSGVTGFTRDMLARLLSAPPRGRADAPITIGGRTIGG